MHYSNYFYNDEELEEKSRIDDESQEKQVYKVHVDRNTNKGYKQRMKHKKQKDKKLKTLILTNRRAYCPGRGYIEYEYIDHRFVPTGTYIKYPKNSKAQKFCKKQSQKKVRALNRNIDEDDPADIDYKKLYDLKWNLY